MFILSFLVILFTIKPCVSFCQTSIDADLYVFSGKNSADSIRPLRFELNEEGLNAYIENTLEFVNFQYEAPTLNQSVLYKGLSQRQLEINYNGFLLNDPSSVEGTYDLSGLFQFNGLALNTGELAELNIKSKLFEDKKLLSLNYGSLGEGKVSFIYGKCKSLVCYKANTYATRLGGVSQLDGGGEDDFLNSYGLSLSRLSRGEVRLATHFFVNSDKSDVDDLINFVDDSNATSKSVSLFFGQEVKFKNQFGLRAHFFQNRRKQENKVDDVNPLSFTARQEGRTYSLNTFYKKLDLNMSREEFDENINTLEDHLIHIKLNQLEQIFLNQLKVGYSIERGAFGDLSFKFKKVHFGYKVLSPSLYQLLDSFVGNEALQPEQSVQLSYINEEVFKKGAYSLKLDASYFRLSQLIDFFDPDGFGVGSPGAFENVNRAENLFLLLANRFEFKNHTFFASIRYLRAKNLSLDTDLLRRARFTGSLNLRSLFTGFRTDVSFKALGKRLSASGGALKESYLSSIELRRPVPKGFLKLSFLNIINDENVVLAGVGRKTFQIKLGVDLNF